MGIRRKPSADPATNERRRLGRERAKLRRMNPVFVEKERVKSRQRSRLLMLAKYGVTEAEFQLMLQRQAYACAICSKPFVDSEGPSRDGKIHVDHDHESGRVRGLLCYWCNAMLGQARDCPSHLSGAISYLVRTGTNKPRRGWAGVQTGKVWGATTTFIDTPMISIHRISVRPHMQCSLHSHQRKWNCFLVLEGQLTIERHKNDYALIDKTELGPWDVCTVPPGERHRFSTGNEGAEAFEIYYLEPLSDDIVRDTCGGPTESLSEDIVRKSVGGVK